MYATYEKMALIKKLGEKLKKTQQIQKKLDVPMGKDQDDPSKNCTKKSLREFVSQFHNRGIEKSSLWKRARSFKGKHTTLSFFSHMWEKEERVVCLRLKLLALFHKLGFFIPLLRRRRFFFGGIINFFLICWSDTSVWQFGFQQLNLIEILGEGVDLDILRVGCMLSLLGRV